MNINPRAEAVDDGKEAVEGKAAEVGVADAGEVGGDAGAGMGGADRQLLTVGDFDDFGGEDGFQLLGVGVGMTEVAEDVAAAADGFDLPNFRERVSN